MQHPAYIGLYKFVKITRSCTLWLTHMMMQVQKLSTVHFGLPKLTDVLLWSPTRMHNKGFLKKLIHRQSEDCPASDHLKSKRGRQHLHRCGTVDQYCCASQFALNW